MTTIDMIEHLKAMENTEITDITIKNSSNISLWFSDNEATYEVKPKEEMVLGN